MYSFLWKSEDSSKNSWKSSKAKRSVEPKMKKKMMKNLFSGTKTPKRNSENEI